MNDLRNTDNSLHALNDGKFIKLLLYGNDFFGDNNIQRILMCTIRFIKN